MLFCLRTSKDSSVGEFDESIISVFICYLSLFYLDFIRFYFLSITILLQLQVILFQEQIFERLRLRAKERLFGGDSGQKHEDSVQKYRHSPCHEETGSCPWRFQSHYPTRKVGTTRASNGTAVRDFQTAFCCFCFFDELPILVYFWPKAHGFLCNTLVIYFLRLKSFLGYK